MGGKRVQEPRAKGEEASSAQGRESCCEHSKGDAGILGTAKEVIASTGTWVLTLRSSLSKRGRVAYLGPIPGTREPGLVPAPAHQPTG